MEFKFGPKLFLKEFLLFLSALALGIFTAHRYVFSVYNEFVPQTVKFSWSDFIFLAIFILLFILASRNKKVSGFLLNLFLILIVFSGTEIVAGTVVGFPWDMVFSFIVLALFLILRNVLVHNIAIIFSLAGLGSILGLSLTTQTIVIILLILSFYDVIAVYKTKHMVAMARNMIESGAVFGFIIPFEFKGFLSTRKEARDKLGEQFMVLGSGDIGLPIIFAGSLVAQSLLTAMFVAGFSLIGLFATHLIFINQKKRAPMAALPPIATMTIIGYLIALLLKI